MKEDEEHEIKSSRIPTTRIAYIGILLFGIISLLGDIIYEGARGIIPPYLYLLEASALIVGIAGGVGDFLGYSLRLLSGYVADTTRAYWLLTFLGYALLLAIPALALTSNWQFALALVLVERLAKAIRTPARDTLLSYVSRKLGAGKAFGLHELLDQIGAVVGPMIVAFVLYTSANDYRFTFSTLVIPYILLVASIIVTYLKLNPYTKVENLISSKNGTEKWKPTITFSLYTLAVAFNTAGLVHITLILYRISPLMIPWMISILYLVVQLVDALSAPLAGLIYDRIGRIILLVPFGLSIVPSILVFSPNLNILIVAALFFGIIYGMHESIYRAAVADLSPITGRGFAYGLFYTAYGIGFLIGGVVFGQLLDMNLYIIGICYTIIMQVLAVALLLKSVKASSKTSSQSIPL